MKVHSRSIARHKKNRQMCVEPKNTVGQVHAVHLRNSDVREQQSNAGLVPLIDSKAAFSRNTLMSAEMSKWSSTTKIVSRLTSAFFVSILLGGSHPLSWIIGQVLVLYLLKSAHFTTWSILTIIPERRSI
jgi:hypothetical protein